MAKISDLAFRYRLFMKTYRYRSYDWGTGSQLLKPVSQAKIAVVTSAAFYLPDQEPFDEELKGGDPTYREIPLDCDLNSLQIGHRSEAFDHSGIEKDKNLALPFDRLRELVDEGYIGSINQNHYSFMGSVTAPGRLLKKYAPEMAEKLKNDQVDAVFLTPV